MPLQDTLNSYRSSIVECNANLNIAFAIDGGGGYIYAQRQREFIVESAFLKIFISWETYLENAFIGYLLGEPSITGRVVNRFATPIDFNHAHKILIGTQRYVDWANSDTVIKLGGLYLEPNNPINDTVGAIKADMDDLRIIRNSAAHMSATTNAALDGLASRKLRTPCSNYSVPQLVLTFDPAAPINNQTILNTYLTILDAAAENIANG
ncbi:MAG: hypothetical protein IM631_05400 [Cytophagales bacterium]|jgi:hypothetical protein|nr:hypothetical protein [Cytophagales bacterium]MCA6370818.1 hypothetical protein [Cytophagales bacterium]MCA6385829.1 hypothetical protein [Cytophagales bacterium]